MSKYLDLLKLILSYGDKIPAILAHVENIVNEVRAIGELLGVPETFQGEAPTPEVLSLEAEVAAAAMGGTETYAGPLQRILDFVRNNPELVALILSLLKK